MNIVRKFKSFPGHSESGIPAPEGEQVFESLLGNSSDLTRKMFEACLEQDMVHSHQNQDLYGNDIQVEKYEILASGRSLPLSSNQKSSQSMAESNYSDTGESVQKKLMIKLNLSPYQQITKPKIKLKRKRMPSPIPSGRIDHGNNQSMIRIFLNYIRHV